MQGPFKIEKFDTRRYFTLEDAQRAGFEIHKDHLQSTTREPNPNLSNRMVHEIPEKEGGVRIFLPPEWKGKRIFYLWDERKGDERISKK